MMHGAGRDMKMKTFIIGPVGIGSRIYPSDVYVAPIDDDMLLGLNILYKYIAHGLRETKECAQGV